MARKKNVLEPQEEQTPDITVPAEETAPFENGAPEGWCDPEQAQDKTDAEADFGCGEGMPGGEEPSAPAGFPATDGLPFEDALAVAAAPQEGAPLELSSADSMLTDGSGPDEGYVSGGDMAMKDDGEDYDAFLKAVSEGGDVQPVPPSEPEPVLLGGTEADGGGGEYGEDGLPPIPEQEDAAAEAPAPTRAMDRRSAPRRERERVLTIDPHAEVETKEDLEELVWHELQNASRTRHILTGKLDSVGRTENGMDVAVILYKGVRVLIPLKEMMVHTGQVPTGPEYALWAGDVCKILNTRQNSDIDFVVRGIDNESRTVVGSRRDAMRRKRKRFYLDTDERGSHLIEEGRVVQARVVSVSDKAVRLEVFGVECNVVAKGISWMWTGSARENHYVGEIVLARVQRIERINVDRIRVQVDRSCIFGEDGDNLSQCQPQCRYVGQVTSVRRGVVFVRLNIGVNALAHTCLDVRRPGKKDTVSFAVTRLDEKNGIAIGIITRIIKQNL